MANYLVHVGMQVGSQGTMFFNAFDHLLITSKLIECASFGFGFIISMNNVSKRNRFGSGIFTNPVVVWQVNTYRGTGRCVAAFNHNCNYLGFDTNYLFFFMFREQLRMVFKPLGLS